jgi:hypothetical protein
MKLKNSGYTPSAFHIDQGEASQAVYSLERSLNNFAQPTHGKPAALSAEKPRYKKGMVIGETRN